MLLIEPIHIATDKNQYATMDMIILNVCAAFLVVGWAFLSASISSISSVLTDNN